MADGERKGGERRNYNSAHFSPRYLLSRWVSTFFLSFFPLLISSSHYLGRNGREELSFFQFVTCGANQAGDPSFWFWLGSCFAKPRKEEKEENLLLSFSLLFLSFFLSFSPTCLHCPSWVQRKTILLLVMVIYLKVMDREKERNENEFLWSNEQETEKMKFADSGNGEECLVNPSKVNSRKVVLKNLAEKKDRRQHKRLIYFLFLVFLR